MGVELQTYGDELVAVLSAATAALRELSHGIHRLSSDELDEVLTAADGLAAVAGAARFTATAEAVERGDVASSQAGSTQQWVALRCPSLDAREAGLVAKAVRELGVPMLSSARAAVADGRLSVSAGCVVASEWRQLRPLVEPTATDSVVAGLVAMGETDGPAAVRRLRPALLARYGLGLVLQDLEDRHSGLTVLSCGHDIGGGITEYRMRLNPEARAVVEAAIDRLAAPQPSPDGAPDPRTIDQRRGQALVEVCRRALAPGTAPSGAKSTVLVTIPATALRDRSRPGTVLGGVDDGALLGPETVRRLVCDGSVGPAVLDGDGRLVDVGRTQRFFTPHQLRALYLRDHHCTFPGCRTPGTWCDAHHVRHWIDGGPTDLDNAALLCGRHHTIVHRDRLAATVGPAGVCWDRTPGSYEGPAP
jgi:hypothetical protein